MTNNKLDAARANLNAALQEEGKALTSACDAASARGTSSDQAVEALRSAQGAHARSNAAASELRALFRGRSERRSFRCKTSSRCSRSRGHERTTSGSPARTVRALAHRPGAPSRPKCVNSSLEGLGPRGLRRR